MNCFRLVPVTILLLLCLTLSQAADLPPSQSRKAAFFRALASQDARYDPNEKMIRRPFSSPGYHTTLKSGFVHPTRDSLNYAVALLNAGSPDRLERAVGILRKVISLQDQNPDSRTYGIWSWFYEEPLDKMSPPDWNWADFCGTQLLQVAREHLYRLPADVQQSVPDSIIHAARSIKRRNVGPGYTNIALMGAYVTLSAGELFNDPDLLDYGRSRLHRFWDYTTEKGSFSEYNSPTYTVVAIDEITRMITQIEDPESRPLLEKLNRFAWLHLARHFHPPTRQWAGPHSRSYSTLLRSSTRAFIQRATEGRITFMPEEQAWQSLDAHSLRAQCPEDYFHYFTDLPEPRLEIETFQKAGAGKHDIVGTTYLHPDFAFASVNIGDLWNQRRPLLAYWKTDKGVVSMRIRCLHDDYDYSSASIFTVQDKADILGAVVFATDRGDTHISLDRLKDATIKAKDLRLRLEFEGAVENLDINQISSNNPLPSVVASLSLRDEAKDSLPNSNSQIVNNKLLTSPSVVPAPPTVIPAQAGIQNPNSEPSPSVIASPGAPGKQSLTNPNPKITNGKWLITSAQVQCTFNVPYATFDNNPIHFETNKESSKATIDIILYSGPNKKFNFNKIQKAAVAFTLFIVPAKTTTQNPDPGPSTPVISAPFDVIPAKAGTQNLSPDSSLYPTISITDGLLKTTFKSMSLTVPLKPTHTSTQRNTSSAIRNNTNP